MTDLRELLDRASDSADSAVSSVPVTDDLARARTALRRNRAWRTGAAAFAVAAVVAGGVGVAAITSSDGAPVAARDQQANGAAGDDIRLVSANATSGPYTLGKLPEGWEIQGENPRNVVIAPTSGGVSPDPNVFLGKLVVTYEQNPLPEDAREVEWNGRTFYLGGDSGYTMIHVATRAGEHEGKVVVQYPSKNWTEKNMLEFADAVRVNEPAEPGVG